MKRVIAFYVDPRGRVSRKSFWVGYFILGLVFESLFELADSIWRALQTGSDVLLTFGVGAHFPTWNRALSLSADAPFVSMFALLWLWPPFAVSSKRLHDLGFSARWLLAYVALGLVFQGGAFLGYSADAIVSSDGTPAPLWYVLAVMGAVGFIASLAIGIPRGQSGTNAYGPDPLVSREIDDRQLANSGASENSSSF